jgi:hypothetical protein
MRAIEILPAYYRWQARVFVRFTGAVGLIPRPLASSLLRRLAAGRVTSTGRHRR